jgi:vacuolar-type H+-ATPase subunit H
VSAIKDLLSEEKTAEDLVKNAERQADEILRNARNKAKELLKETESDNSRIKEITELSQSRVQTSKLEILDECNAQASEEEKQYERNLDEAIKLIVENVLGRKQ